MTRSYLDIAAIEAGIALRRAFTASLISLGQAREALALRRLVANLRGLGTQLLVIDDDGLVYDPTWWGLEELRPLPIALAQIERAAELRLALIAPIPRWGGKAVLIDPGAHGLPVLPYWIVSPGVGPAIKALERAGVARLVRTEAGLRLHAVGLYGEPEPSPCTKPQPQPGEVVPMTKAIAVARRIDVIGDQVAKELEARVDIGDLACTRTLATRAARAMIEGGMDETAALTAARIVAGLSLRIQLEQLREALLALRQRGPSA